MQTAVKTKKPRKQAVSGCFWAMRTYRGRIKDDHKIDPACGSGNFLTETYISVRRLENRVISSILNCEKGAVDGQIAMGDSIVPIKVEISQFYGIEINDFAVTVAKTALWIAESQMLKETEDILLMHLDFLPLKTNAYIHEGNALRVDWEEIIPKDELNYIMGNPPFIGSSLMTSMQKQDTVSVLGKIKLSNSIDYVGAWYIKAARLMQKNNKIKTSYVSTNSITQGEQVFPLWSELLHKYETDIFFAYRTFIWNSESNDTAKVHCVIIGLYNKNDPVDFKRIYEGEKRYDADNISPYLIAAPSVLVDSYPKPICDVPICGLGNTAKDNGYLILNREEKDAFIKKYPQAQKLIRRYIGGRDFIRNDEERYCFWLKGVAPNEYNNIPELLERIKAVKEFREASTSKDTRKTAQTPYLFFRTPHVDDSYLIIPRTTSQRRRYLPLGFVDGSNIGSDAIMTVYGANLYHFGILISNVHASWMRTVGGRLKSDYRYSGVVVYNTFPWPTPTEEQRKKIEQTAQGILDARALYPYSSLADLYDPLTMPIELQKAHIANDKAVMQAYGFSVKDTSEADCVAALMKMYQELTKEEK